MDFLDSDTPYKFIPYLNSSSPLDTHLPLNVVQTSTWTYSGPLLSPLSLPSSLHSWSDAALSSSPALLQRLVPLLTFLNSYLRERDLEHYWITLRATTPTREYDVPRWHVDDDFFGDVRSSGYEADAGTTPCTQRERWNWRSKTRAQTPKSRNADAQQSRWSGAAAKKKKKEERECDWKLCTTLLGPSTLFLPSVHQPAALRTLQATKSQEAAKREHVCSSIRCAGCGDTGDAVRELLATSFASLPPIQSTYGSMAIFKTGDGGAVHSEPSCREEGGRVFVNIVPGTEEGLRKLMDRFGMEWPRSWSMGVMGGAGVERGQEGEKTDVTLRTEGLRH